MYCYDCQMSSYGEHSVIVCKNCKYNHILLRFLACFLLKCVHLFQYLQVLIHFIIFLLKSICFSRMFDFEAANGDTIKFCFHGNINRVFQKI